MLGIVARPYQSCLALAITAMSVAVAMGAVTGVSAQEVPILVELPRWYPVSADYAFSQAERPKLVSDGIDEWRGFWTTPSGHADDDNRILAFGENVDCDPGWRDWEYQEAPPWSSLRFLGVDSVPGGTWVATYESYFSEVNLWTVRPIKREERKTWVIRSSDGGANWDDPRLVGISNNSPYIQLLTWSRVEPAQVATDGNGNWLLTRTRGEHPSAFSKSFEVIESRVSKDDAVSWSLPVLSQRFYQVDYYEGQLLGNGSSFLFGSIVSCEESDNLCGPARGSGNPRRGYAVLRTTDLGKSWHVAHEVWGRVGELYEEIDGRVLFWSLDCPDTGDCVLSIDSSEDDGETWIEGVDNAVPFSSHESPELLSDGRGNMILFWISPFSRGSISMIYSTDDGTTWSNTIELSSEDFGFPGPQWPNDFRIEDITGTTDGRGLWRILFVLKNWGEEESRIPEGLYSAGWRFGDESYTEGESSEGYYPECNSEEYPPIERPVLACGATGFEDGAWLPLGDLVVVLLAFVALWKGSSCPFRSISTESKQ